MKIKKVLELMDELEETHNNSLSRWNQLRRLLEQADAVKQSEQPALSCGYCHDVDNAVEVDPGCPEHGWQSTQRTVEHAEDCAVYVGVLGECDCGAEE